MKQQKRRPQSTGKEGAPCPGPPSRARPDVPTESQRAMAPSAPSRPRRSSASHCVATRSWMDASACCPQSRHLPSQSVPPPVPARTGQWLQARPLPSVSEAWHEASCWEHLGGAAHQPDPPIKRVGQTTTTHLPFGHSGREARWPHCTGRRLGRCTTGRCWIWGQRRRRTAVPAQVGPGLSPEKPPSTLETVSKHGAGAHPDLGTAGSLR